MIAARPSVDSIIYIGLGIQSNQQHLVRRATSIRTTGWSASSLTTSGRTSASRRRRPSSASGTASRSCVQPSWPSPTRTMPALGRYARQAACVTPAATTRSDRVGPSLGVRPLPAGTRHELMRARNPYPALVVAALAPGLLLGAIWRSAEGKRPAGVHVSAGDGSPVAVPPVMNTPLLSVRRAPSLLTVEASEYKFTAALQPLLEVIGETACVSVTLDDRTIAARNDTTPLDAARPTQQLDHRRSRPGRVGCGLPLLDADQG